MRQKFDKLLAWRIRAAQANCRVERVTKGKANHYWQATKGGAVVGFFNDPQDGRKAGGELEVPNEPV
jgi:hypothetical protein